MPQENNAHNMTLSKSELDQNRNVFKTILKGRTVIVGIGNTMRGDDAAGVELVRLIQGKVNAVCIDAGAALENHAGKIIRENPSTILLVDAASMDKRPFEYEIFQSADISARGFTTHDMSSGLFIKYLVDQTKADIYMLGIQPKTLKIGEAMSDGMLRIVADLARLIKEALDA